MGNSELNCGDKANKNDLELYLELTHTNTFTFFPDLTPTFAIQVVTKPKEETNKLYR